MPRPERCLLGALAAFAVSIGAAAAPGDIEVNMFKATANGTGESVGTITITSAPNGGASFRLALHGLPPGAHGFHVHQNDSCLPTLINDVRTPAGAAGGHWDPEGTGKHGGPTGEGHKGDLPVLEVAANGTAEQTLVAPHIRDIHELPGHSLMIHVGGDNYSDAPQALGGGGARFACGVIPK